MTASVKKLNWSHKDNLAVYEEVSLSFFDEFAKEAGLDNHCDLKQIDKYIKGANSILEVGGGSGRVLDYFEQINYPGRVTTVEWSKPLYEHLQRNYGRSVEVVHSDIMDYQPTKKFDLIVWMWGSVGDFASYEHETVLKHLCSMLSDKGVVVFDTAVSKRTLLSINSLGKNNFIINCKNGDCKTRSNLYFYLPPKDELLSYVKHLGLSYTPIHFSTKTNRNRVLHVLRK